MQSREINHELDILRPRLKRTTGKEFIKVAERINELEEMLKIQAEYNRPIEIDTFDIDSYVMDVDFRTDKTHKFTSSLYRDDKDDRIMPSHPMENIFPNITSIY